MQIFVITEDLKSVGLASRLVVEGHDVKIYSPVRLPEDYGNLTKVTHPYEAIKECQFVIADKISDLDIYKWAKTFNKPIIGCSLLTDVMNADCFREYTVGAKLGVSMPPTEIIHDMSEMYSKVIDWNPSRTLIRYDRETITCDHQEWLAWAMNRMPLNKQILLQTPPFGEELTVFGWFDGLRWARPFVVKTNKESQMSSSLMLGLTQRDWMDKIISPWSTFLKATGYKGPFTVRAVISKQAIQVISTYAGFEFPSMYAFFEGLKEPAGEFLNRIAFGVCYEQDFTTDYVSSIVVRTNLKEPTGVPIIGIDQGNSKHLFFGSVSKVEEETVVLSGPWIYTITAHGRTPEESMGRAYHTNQVVKVPEPNYPTNVTPLYSGWFNKLKSMELI